MIIIASLGATEQAYRQFNPSRVISILDFEELAPPAFEGLAPEHHLKVIDDCSHTAKRNGNGDLSRCEKLIELAQEWDQSAPILIHCHQGVSRSTAAAYVILCAVEDGCEKKIAARLRQAAPHAEPNLLLISEADELLGRHDRMVEAVLDLCPSSATVAAPIVTLHVAT